jgi:hypothetical protein
MRLNLRYFDYCFLGGNTLFMVEWQWILELPALHPDDGVFLLHRGDEDSTLFWNEVKCIADMRNSLFTSMVFVTVTAWTARGSNPGRGRDFLHTRTAQSWAHPASCTKGTGFLCRGWGDRSVALTPHSHMTPRFKKRAEVYVYSCGPHAQLTLLRMFIILHLVSTSSVGHYKAIVQEYKITVEVETSCQIINIRKRVSCVWLKTSLCIGVLH